MSLIDRYDSFLAVIDVQPGFYRDRPDVRPAVVTQFVERVAWVAQLAQSLHVPTVVTVERPERNGETDAGVARALPVEAPVFEKRVFDLSSQSDIAEAISSFNRKTAVLVGMETDVCIAHSASGLLERGYRVVAVADATYSPEGGHEHGIQRLRGMGAELLSCKQLFYEWLPTLDEVRQAKQACPTLSPPPGFHL